MKKKIIAVLLVIVISAAAYWAYHKLAAEQTSHLTASGTIEAVEVKLNAKVPGTIEQISIDSGDAVKQGQLVAQLERNDLLAQKERDALGVAQAHAQLNDLLSGARDQEVEIAAAEADIAQANYEKANSDFEKIQHLFTEGAVPKQQLEQAETQLKNQEKQLEAAKAKVSLLRAGNRENTIEAARVELERRKAILKASQSLLEDTKIISPIDGKVLAKNYEQGESVPAGAAVASVLDTADMWIKVYIPTDRLTEIKLGQQVHFTVSGSDDKYQGTVNEIADQGEFTPKTIQTKQERTNIVYEVKIKIDDHDGVLKPGMPADVIFDGDDSD